MTPQPIPGTCSACAHWGREFPGVCDGLRGDVKRSGGDYPHSHGWSYSNSLPDGFAIEASASDDTNLTAHLVTGPAFGCNRFALRCPVCKGGRGEIDARGYWVGPCKACDGTGCAPKQGTTP